MSKVVRVKPVPGLGGHKTIAIVNGCDKSRTHEEGIGVCVQGVEQGGWLGSTKGSHWDPVRQSALADHREPAVREPPFVELAAAAEA